MKFRSDEAPRVLKGEPSAWRRRALRSIACLSGALALLAAAASSPAAAESRTLDLYFAHTGETLKIVYKRDGRYIPSAMKEINHFLRDWRRNESTKMDPELIDLLWATQQHFGGRRITVVSAYRSPATNAMLRSRSRGVAKHSQHMLGHATDFFISGVALADLRAWGVTRQVGGVGYYPTSGSPFVHFDVGSVRAWPRMSRSQLVKLFPDGKTLHLPADGGPLSGYAAAQQLEKQGKLAKLDTGGGMGGGGGSLLAGLFGGGRGGGSPANDRGTDRVQVASVQPTATAEARPARRSRATEAEDQPVRVQTASVETRGTTDEGEDRGFFRQLPSVSLGGLIDRFRDDEGDEAAATPEVVPVTPPSAPLTAVAPQTDEEAAPASPAAAATATRVPVPSPAPRPAAPAAAPAAPATGEVVVAALPPQRPGTTTGSDTLAYATAEETVDGSPLNATAAIVPRPPALPREAVAAPPTPAVEADLDDDLPPVIATDFAPVRGASQQLIADASGIDGGGFATLTAPDRQGAASGGVLLAQGFLGAPSSFSSEAPTLNTDRFTGLTITVFAKPRS